MCWHWWKISRIYVFCAGNVWWCRAICGWRKPFGREPRNPGRLLVASGRQLPGDQWASAESCHPWWTELPGQLWRYMLIEGNDNYLKKNLWETLFVCQKKWILWFVKYILWINTKDKVWQNGDVSLLQHPNQPIDKWSMAWCVTNMFPVCQLREYTQICVDCAIRV